MLVCVLLSTAVLIYAERKIWAAVQLRRGPNVVGPWGVLQPFADFFKFLLKEPVIPDGAEQVHLRARPWSSASCWPWPPGRSSRSMTAGSVANINVGVLYLFAVSSLGVYGVIMGGWASNSKYPFLAALRSAAQMVSYEVSIGFVIVTVLLCAGSLNLTDIVHAQDTRYGVLGWYWLRLLPMYRDLLHLGPGRNQPPALRSRRGGIGARRGLHGRIFGLAVPAVHSWPSYVAIVGMCVADDDALLRRLAARRSPGRRSSAAPSVFWFLFKMWSCSSSCSRWPRRSCRAIATIS